MGQSPLPGQGLRFTNIPRSAIRISQNPKFAFLICHTGEPR
jgi:hypothetical protein